VQNILKDNFKQSWPWRLQDTQ